MTLTHHRCRTAGIFLVLALLSGIPADAQVLVKVNDDTFFKFGLLVQPQADALQDAVGRGYGQNVFVRRARILVGGQLAKNVSFFAETDSPNLGKSLTAGSKNSQPSMYLQDAYVELKINNAFALDFGLMLPSVSRNGLQSAASLMALDYGPYTFAHSGPLQLNVGRDTGVQAKGYLAKNKFEYRAGLFQGVRDQADRALRFTGRAQYNFLDPETGFFYSGTYLGKKKVFAIGAGVDMQDGYSGYGVDLFYDHPVAGGAVTARGDLIQFDGGTFLKSLPEQRNALVELGYLIGTTKFQPVLQLSQRNFADSARADETRIGLGLNYYISGHNANVKGLITRIDTDGRKTSTQATVQVQFFYF